MSPAPRRTRPGKIPRLRADRRARERPGFNTAGIAPLATGAQKNDFRVEVRKPAIASSLPSPSVKASCSTGPLPAAAMGDGSRLRDNDDAEASHSPVEAFRFGALSAPVPGGAVSKAWMLLRISRSLLALCSRDSQARSRASISSSSSSSAASGGGVAGGEATFASHGSGEEGA